VNLHQTAKLRRIKGGQMAKSSDRNHAVDRTSRSHASRPICAAIRDADDAPKVLCGFAGQTPVIHTDWFEKTANELPQNVVNFHPPGVPGEQVNAVRKLMHNSLEEFLNQIRQQLAGLEAELAALMQKERKTF
jgi:hypothetical protein